MHCKGVPFSARLLDLIADEDRTLSWESADYDGGRLGEIAISHEILISRISLIVCW